MNTLGPKRTRRAFLAGTGKVMLALPVAELAFRGERLVAVENPEPVTRLLTYSYPNGSQASQWNYGAMLSPLAPLQQKIVVLANLANTASVPGDHHEQGAATMFVGRKIPAGQVAQKAEKSGGISLDQYAVKKMQPPTPIGSMVTGLWRVLGEFNYPKAWYRRSWDERGEAVEPFVNPRDIYNRLFGAQLDPGELKARRSIVDAVLGMYKHVTSEAYGLEQEAKHRLTQHLDSLRDIEKGLAESDRIIRECRPSDPNAIPGAPSSLEYVPYTQWEGIFRAQWNLMILGMKCDLFRYGSLMFGSAAEKFHLPNISSRDEHACAHRTDRIQETLAYRRYHMSLLAAFLKALDSVQEGDRTMLDSTIVIAASELETSGGNHQAHPMGHLVAGGTGLVPKLGQLVDVGLARSTVDLYRDVLKAAGIPAEEFGDSALVTGSILGT